jgi:uncharacterized pyridoxamine 5'-phosphate oxidase family protein
MLVLSGHRPRRPGDSIHRFRNIVVVFKRHSYLVKINNQKNKKWKHIKQRKRITISNVNERGHI